MLTNLIVVGPPASGKSTVAAQLADHLGLNVVSIDENRNHYYGPAYDDCAAQVAFDRGGASRLHSYESPFELYALATLVDADVRGVIDTGGGLLWQRTGENRERLRALLSRTQCVIMCMPGGEAADSGNIVGRLLDRHADRAAADPFVERWLVRGGVEVLKDLVDAARSCTDVCDIIVNTDIEGRCVATLTDDAVGAVDAAAVWKPAGRTGTG